MGKLFALLRSCEKGVTAIEYAVIAGVISIALVAAVSDLGSTLSATFEAVAAGF